jgi:hypothetical protein
MQSADFKWAAAATNDVKERRYETKFESDDRNIYLSDAQER